MSVGPTYRPFSDVVADIVKTEMARRAAADEDVLSHMMSESGGCRSVALGPPARSGSQSGRGIVTQHEWPRRRFTWLRGRGRCFCGDTR